MVGQLVRTEFRRSNVFLNTHKEESRMLEILLKLENGLQFDRL